MAEAFSGAPRPHAFVEPHIARVTGVDVDIEVRRTGCRPLLTRAN